MERTDEIGFGGLTLIQEPGEFCFGVDAVILADFAAKNASSFKSSGELTAVDLGTGTGIIPLILTAKTGWKKIGAVEIQDGSFDRLKRNVEANGLKTRVVPIQGDVKEILKKIRSKEPSEWTSIRNTVRVVTSNPPYTSGGGGIPNNNSAKYIARHETTADLEDFMQLAAELLAPGGDLFMVHRPSRLADLCCAGRQFGLEPKKLQFICPKPGRAPNIILMHFIKGAGKELRVLDPLTVHSEDGGYTSELLKCYE